MISELVTELENKIPLEFSRNDLFMKFFREVNTYLGNIRNTNSFMLMSINRTMDYTKASRGLKLLPHLDTVNLKETLSLPLSCMKNIQDKVQIRLLPINPRINNFIVTDRQWLQENILCLLSNAAKYSSGGEVTVKVHLRRIIVKNPRRAILSTLLQDNNKSQYLTTEDLSPNTYRRNSLAGPITNLTRVNTSKLFEEYLCFEVEDNGIGMTSEMMQSLFSPFKQAQRLAGGTGLGLYSLSKRIEALEGKYGVKERADGRAGCLFWFTIPYRPDFGITDASDVSSKNSAAVTPPNKTRSSRSKSSYEIQPVSCKAETSVSQSYSPLNESNSLLTSKLKILLVEDSPTIAKMTRIMIEKLGHEVTIAENGHIALNLMTNALDEALANARYNNTEISPCFDVVLMDFQMPVMDGLEATRRYREYEKNACTMKGQFHQIIIGLSATSDPDIVQESLKLGLDDYLMKPISKDLFLKKVDIVLKSKLMKENQ